MNKILSLSIMMLLAVSVLAQQAEAPRTEYTVSLSENTVSIKPGETKTISLNILRSKQYSKSKAYLGFSSAIPDGLTISYEPAEGLLENSTVTINAAPTLKDGTYQVVLKTTINNKIKGSIVKINVGTGVVESVTVN